MVTIVDHRVVQNNATQEEFVMLVVQGSPEMVQSKETGKFYMTARKCSIPCTFTPVVALTMIGQQMPGQIVKVPCEPYEYAIPDTGEVITLEHSWEYRPDGDAKADLTKQPVHENGMAMSY